MNKPAEYEKVCPLNFEDALSVAQDYVDRVGISVKRVRIWGRWHPVVNGTVQRQAM